MKVRLSKFRAFVGATALSAAMLAMAVPAQALNVNAACEEDGHFFNGAAFYQVSGSFHSWTEWRYILQDTGDKSNVNIRLRDNGTLRYSNNSPDNRKENQLYTHTPPFPITLRASHNEVTTFEAVFDEFGPDDRCFASTPDP